MLVHLVPGDVADKRLDRPRRAPGDLSQRRLVAIDQHQVPPRIGKQPGAGGADPVGRAGDDRHAHSASP